MSTRALANDWDTYQRAFRIDAHQLLAWGYADSHNSITAEAEEEVITAYIAKAIECRIDDPRTPESFTRYSIHNVHFVSPGGQTGKRQLKLDLMLEQCGIRPKRHFVFEAKRLKTRSHPIGDYVGKDGLGRFVFGQYAASDPEAAMLGYIQNRDATYWFSELERIFSDDESSGHRSLRIAKGLRKVSVVSDMLNEWSSIHDRTRRKEILMFHVFLDCSQTKSNPSGPVMAE
jgi:hypothetical protein